MVNGGVNAGAAGTRTATESARTAGRTTTINQFQRKRIRCLWYIFDSLKALTQNDPALLCGRADVVREIVDNCRAERLTVVTAEPGMGITSLLQAGAVPALRRRGFIVAVFSDWQGRFFATALREAIAEAVREQADDSFFAQGEPVDELLQRIRAVTGKSAVILLDQFEDYVRCHSNTVISDNFDAELAHAVATRKGMFVIGLQEYALPAFERLGQHIPNLLGFQIRLPPLSVEAAREAVLSEARGVGLEVEPAVLDALTSAPVTVVPAKSPSDEKKVHPFFLKVATGVLIDAEARLKSPVMRAATIEARDGVDRVVLESLDGAIAELGSTQVDLLFRWCTILISSERHRLAVTEKGLNDYAGKWSRFAPRLLELLTGSGILRSIETPDAIRYEISRDCFAPILRDWWERREAVIVARRRAVFRVTSISVALSAIVLMYVIWLIFGSK
jgi:hypothetical protein